MVLMGMASRAEIARRCDRRRPQTRYAGGGGAQWHRAGPKRACVRLSMVWPWWISGPPARSSSGRWPLDVRPVDRSRRRARGGGHTSPVPGGVRLALVDAGATVVELPVIAIADPADDGAAWREEVARIDTFDWIAVTSSNAVARLLDRGALRVAGRYPVGRRRMQYVGSKMKEVVPGPALMDACTRDRRGPWTVPPRRP